mgnify:FL=1
MRFFFYCEKCDYKCFRKYDYNKHNLTSKHQNQQKSTENSENSENSENFENFEKQNMCLICNKIFN